MNKNLKIIILGTLAVFGMLVFGWLNKLAFFSNSSWIMIVIYLALAFMIGVGSWGIAIYLIRSRWTIYLVSVLAIFTLFFFVPINIYYVAALAMILIYSIFAIERIKVEKEGRIKIMLYESTNIALKSIAGALCLIATLNYYYSPVSNQTQFDFPEKYQQKTMSYILPGFNQDMTIDEFIYALMAKQEGVKNLNLKNYIARKKAETSPEEFSNYKNSIFERLKIANINLGGQEKLSEAKIFEKIYHDQIEEYFIKYAKIIRLVLTVLFFGTLYGAVRITYPLIYLILWLFFKLFEKTGFSTITKKQVTAEEISL